jgi:hypothetical protein
MKVCLLESVSSERILQEQVFLLDSGKLDRPARFPGVGQERVEGQGILEHRQCLLSGTRVHLSLK